LGQQKQEDDRLVSEVEVSPSKHDPEVVERTFLIADVRGYTRFTRQRGDAGAARLAGAFAGLARDAVAARGGTVIELRGDEALAVFVSPAQAVRAAVELVAMCAEDVDANPDLPTATLQQLGADLPGGQGLWGNLAFTPDGRYLLVVFGDGTAYRWPATVSAWEHHACTVAGRNFTREEWSRYVIGRGYATTCGQFPAG
jgi:class 3 adenylate cyclase